VIRAITEVGVAVRNLEEATRLMVERLGAVPGPVQRADLYDMEFCMCRVGNVDFELMAPIGKEGVIAKFLDSHGEGLHHVAFAVDDIGATQADLGARGLQFVDAAPGKLRFSTADFSGKRMDADIGFAFSRPKSLLGMLLEFIEYPPDFVTPEGSRK